MGLSVLSPLTLVASMRCKPCCLSSTQAKNRPSGPVAWNGTATGRGAKAAGGPGATSVAANGLIGFSSARATAVARTSESKAQRTELASRGGQISHRCESLHLTVTV